MPYKYGKTSKRRGEGVNPILWMVAVMALAYSRNDMSIPWRGGKRTAKQQLALYNAGNSRCDGTNLVSFHQSGEALDIVPYVNGKIDYKAFKEFQAFAKLMFATFEYLQKVKMISPKLHLHWGGFWSAKDLNRDGYLSSVDDKFGWDLPHWELRDNQQRNVLKIK